MPRRTRLAVLTCLAVTLLAVPEAGRAQTSGDGAGDGTGVGGVGGTATGADVPIDQQIFDLKAALDAETQRQAEITASIQELDGQIAVATTETRRSEKAVAEAENGVLVSAGRVDMMARALYQHPALRLSSFLQSRSFNDFVLGQDYLRRTLSTGSDTLDQSRQAKADKAGLENELRDRQSALEAAKAEREKEKKIVDASIAKLQADSARLTSALAAARASGSLPWGGFPGCEVAPRTGLDGPWTLEDWAAATLKSLALRSSRPVAEVLTHEHIVALIAFAWGEGGGTQNHKGWFNPLNTNGWTRLFPELQGRASGFGTDDWPTFDAGVEATARAVTSKTQNRLAKTLLIPTSTAVDFFRALASASQFEGNKNWSADDAAQAGKYDSILSRMSTRYTEYGSTVLQASGQPPTPGVPRTPTGVGPAGFADTPMGC